MTQIAFFQFIVGLAAFSIIVLTLYSLSSPIPREDIQGAGIDTIVGILPTEVLIAPPIREKEHLPTHLSAAATPNDAPHLKFEPKLCKNATMFGTPHKGGWFVCGDQMVTQPTDVSVPLSVSGGVGAEKCIVYSYGLGADW